MDSLSLSGMKIERSLSREDKPASEELHEQKETAPAHSQDRG